MHGHSLHFFWDIENEEYYCCQCFSIIWSDTHLGHRVEFVFQFVLLLLICQTVGFSVWCSPIFRCLVHCPKDLLTFRLETLGGTTSCALENACNFLCILFGINQILVFSCLILFLTGLIVIITDVLLKFPLHLWPKITIRAPLHWLNQVASRSRQPQLENILLLP